ncbi:hypothetical protein TSUD_303360 [Trifolium subterraneum]|uniref:PH domain-containing protein n=1 Tax=Trifolium subterraneum TaxID=3900 RepID=A0A2Z6LN68_TRISU|nr:hypothetical protein TSUD_303360 [Trifolium subterraneum]
MQSFRNVQNKNESGSSSVNQSATPFRSLSTCNRTSRTSTLNRPPVQRSASARLARQNTSREVMLNDIVGNGISGILHKWVNYGRGWRPRWFVLHDGVLSYYKIHGPDKLILNRDVENQSKVIGDESLRRIASDRNSPSRNRKPVSEIHLTVCSVRENKTDERRFSICTGTKKRIHLRAESKEDRTMWMEAMMAVKSMYPRLPTTQDVLSPSASVVISTDKLRQRLLQEGVNEVLIRECEDIMRAELFQLHTYIVALKQKQLLLTDTLHGSGSEYSDEQNRNDQSDDDETDAFFDTYEILSSTNNEEASSPPRECDSKSTNEFNYPYVDRRKKLPDPNEKETGGDNLMRILYLAAFAVSGYANTSGRSCKPFNPLLACHCEGRGWKFWGDSILKSKFWGRSIQLDPIGILTVEFDDGEIFYWSKVTTSIYNLILGKLYCDHYGTMRIEGNREHSCKVKFKEQSIIDRNPHQVHGTVEDKKGKTAATLFGKWDDSLHYIIGGHSGKGKGSNMSSKPHMLWKKNQLPEQQTRYNLTEFALTLNEITPGLKVIEFQ